MADSTVIDVSKLKVVDLRKELKSRGLSYAGDKAELVARLQAVIVQEDHGVVSLDSDEIDSDGVLEDEDDKNHTDILDEIAVDTLNEELAFGEHTVKPTSEIKPQRTLKRKSTTTETEKNNSQDVKDVCSKKIVLNRAVSSAPMPKPTKPNNQNQLEEKNQINNKVKITADIDPKTRLEMRAKRFGLPIKMTDAERKEARKQRFGQIATINKSINSTTNTLQDNLEKLKQRAQRFGQSVSSIMTDIENKEKLEKRKEKFNVAK